MGVVARMGELVREGSASHRHPSSSDLSDRLDISGASQTEWFKAMGLFDLFKGTGKKDNADRPKANAAARWAERAGDKRAQNYDRQEAISALAEMGTADAVTALLKRFTFHIDPSITDQEEKDGAFAGILRAGKDAVEPTRAWAAKAESLGWAMRVIKEVLSEDEYIDELLLWLGRWDQEYSKFIDPKLQLLVQLGDHKSSKIAPAVEPFLQDVNETARFHAVATTLLQEDASCIPALLRILPDEESLRVKHKLADGVAMRGWVIPEEARADTRKHLPPGFSIDGEGVLKKRENSASPFGIDF